MLWSGGPPVSNWKTAERVMALYTDGIRLLGVMSAMTANLLALLPKTSQFSKVLDPVVHETQDPNAAMQQC